MESIKNFLRDKMKWIVIILTVLLTLKSCQSCNRKQEINFARYKTEITADSLNKEIAARDSIIFDLQRELSVAEAEKKADSKLIEELSKDKSDYKKLNESLAKTAYNNAKNQSQK